MHSKKYNKTQTLNVSKKELIMIKLLSIGILSLFISLVSLDVQANHCSGGHKEIKDTKDSTSEDSKETKSSN